MKYGEPNSFFLLYDFESKRKEEREEYLPYPIFRRQRNELNQHSFSFVKTAEHFDYLCLLRDKFYFGQFLKNSGFRTPQNKYLIFGQEGTLFNFDQNKTTDLEEILNYDLDAFCKIAIGECGKGVFHLEITNKKILIDGNILSYDQFKRIVCEGTFLVQERLIQHHLISAIYPKAVNTLRIITMRKANGDCVFLSSCLRVGANGNNVDNWAKGGLALGINSDGTLKHNGYYEFRINNKWVEEEHPDTHLIFDGYKIPYYKESIESVVNLHRLFYGIATIGWDVAITEEGPCIIEGNDNYEISINQVADKGLRSKWEEIYYTYK